MICERTINKRWIRFGIVFKRIFTPLSLPRNEQCKSFFKLRSRSIHTGAPFLLSTNRRSS